MPKKMYVCKEITWLDDEIHDGQNVSYSIHHYKKFQFKNIIAEVGDFVLISNADAAEPDTEEGCDVAKILSLYEDSTHKSDPYRAKVQWYSKHHDLPSWCFNNTDPINFLDKEVIEDHRPFDTDVSIETFFKKCSITFTLTRDVDVTLKDTSPYHYVCRYRLLPLSKRRVQIEPVLEEERRALEILFTPKKNNTSPKYKTPKTPSTLIKKMNRVSISEQKNWSVSKNEGTKMLLKRNIFSENKDTTPRNKMKTPNTTPIYTETPRSTRKLSKSNIEEILSMELKENPNEELPTLIIRQHVLNTPKRKSSISKTSDSTPRKMLVFDDEETDNFKITTTRSGRVTRNPKNYREDISHFTTKKSVNRLDTDSDEDFKPVPRTSKTPRNPRTVKATPTTRTPKRRVSKKTCELTPTLHSRVHSVDNSDGFLTENQSLPGREQQLGEILAFVRSKLLDKTSGCMYISGVPGTGKTATVCIALKILKEEVDLPDFQLVEVNGMKIAEPRQAYVQIYKQLTGKSVVWEQACSLLEKRFTNPGPRRTPTVLLVDELDALCTRRQDVLYSIMEWAGHNTALLTVLTVANTMDLPERALAARVASRLGLTRLTFPPYTHMQLQRIVAMRLADSNVTCDAMQLIARKVAAISGDARRALALCDRALELSENGQAGLKEVQQALGEATSSITVRAIRNCSPAERLMLRAVAAEVERTGSDETTLSRALATAAAIVTLDGRPYKSAVNIRAPTPSQAQALCTRLAANKLLLLEPKGAECRVLLNVSADDVYYATKQITV